MAWSGEGEAPWDSKERDRRYRRLLALADVVAAATALILCVPSLGRADQLTPAGLAVAPLVVLAAKVIGLYDRDELRLRKSTLDEAPALFQLATFSALLLWLGNSVLVAGELGRDQVLGFWGVLFVSLVGARVMARAVARSTTPSERCLVIGDAEAGRQVHDKIETSHGVDASVVAMVPFERPDGSVLDARGLEAVARSSGVHRVLLALSTSDRGEALDLIRAAKALGLKVSVVPRMLEVVGSSMEFDDVDGVNVLGVRKFGLSRSSRAIKRVVDVVVTVVALLVLLPLLATIAAAIKLDSRGPVLFRQRRVGREGRYFEMVKFRTMGADAELRKDALRERNEAGDGLFKIAADPRVTRVGRLLRSTSLDELPQLINVLRDEMSLVGPRPLVVEDDERIEGWNRRRLHLQPGMTGRWQVLGSARVPLHEMVKLDYLYVANWSLWGDLKIMLRTVPVVIGRRGL